MIFDAIYTMANMHGPENQGMGVGMAVFNMTSNDQFLHFFFSFCIFRHCSSRGLNILREVLPLKDRTMVLLNWLLKSLL